MAANARQPSNILRPERHLCSAGVPNLQYTVGRFQNFEKSMTPILFQHSEKMNKRYFNLWLH